MLPEKKKALDSPWNLGKIASWHDRWRLVVDPNLEAGGAPVNELDRPKVLLISIHFALLFHLSLALSMSLDPDLEFPEWTLAIGPIWPHD